MVTVTVEGVPKLQRNLRRSATLIVVLSSNAVEASAQRIVYKARALAPVLTGSLQKAIDYSMSRGGTKAYIGIAAGTDHAGGSPAVYWRFVEFGTRWAPARPMFRPAAESEAGPFVVKMEQAGRRLEREID